MSKAQDINEQTALSPETPSLQPAESRPCAHCGNPFRPRTKAAKFCSLRCFGDSKIKHEEYRCPKCGGRKSWGKHLCRGCWKVAASEQKTGVQTTCGQCGGALYLSNGKWAGSSRKHGAFCNRSCHAAFTKGTNNPGYIHGRNPGVYLEGYRKQRARILERDGNKCFLCRKAGRLDCHHIDRNELNNEPWNMVALCRLCHQHQKGQGKLMGNLVEITRLSNALYAALSQAYGYQSRSIIFR